LRGGLALGTQSQRGHAGVRQAKDRFGDLRHLMRDGFV
jgi:hypothetical protein